MKNTLKKLCAVIILISPSLSFGMCDSPTHFDLNSFSNTSSIENSELRGSTNDIETRVFSINVPAITTVRLEE